MGEAMTPPIAAPGPVRKLLRFVRLPDRALATLRRVVDEDDGFRARVAEAAIEGDLGRPSWLWLVRPEGWEEKLALLEQEAADSASSAREERDERGARRRLAAADEARRRADAAAAAAGAAAARAAEDLVAERQARRSAEVRTEALATRLAKLEGQVISLEAEAEQAERSVVRLQAAETALTAERARLRDRIDELENELSTLRDNLEHAALEAPAPAPPGDATGAAAAIADAAAAARQLGTALAAAARALSGGSPGEGNSQRQGPDGPELVSGEWDELDGMDGEGWLTARAGGEVGDDRTPGSPYRPDPSGVGRDPRGEVAGRPPAWPRRQAAPLPPAVFEDSATAADHLLRIPGMVLLVDGYNVTLQAWPEVPIPEQRRRLVDALAGLAARTGAEVQVVFDGAEQVEHRGQGLPPRSAVRVRFSPPDVDADDVLIDLCDVLPIGRPVTVATSDRRVQDEVRRRGGNIISTPQLLGAIAAR
jgi:predicted RNA-binding protein with PIN domain